MKIYRVSFGECDEMTIEGLFTTAEAAKAAMVEAAQYSKEDGEPYWRYTWRRVEALEFDAAGRAYDEDWNTILECSELTDLFPEPENGEED